MQVRLMVERGQDECVVKLAGNSYKFRRNKFGHMVGEITDPTSLKWIETQRQNSYIPYVAPPEPVGLDDIARELSKPPVERISEVSPFGEDSIAFPCPTCGKPFPTEGRMKSHVRGAHSRRDKCK